MKQKYKKHIAVIVVFSMIVSVFSVMPMLNTANAVNSLTAASILISDSAPGATATYTFDFTTAIDTPQNGSVEVVFPAAFTNINGLDLGATCMNGSADWTEGQNGTQDILCTQGNVADFTAATTRIVVPGVLNPTATTSHVIWLNHYTGAGQTTLVERVQVVLQVIDTALMTARVDSTLTFTVEGVASGQSVNGTNCDQTTTATTTPFGTLAPATPTTVCQDLKVTTNASDGFTVTVEQDQELTSSGGDNINSFNDSPDGTGSTTAVVWASPAGTLDSDWTYGHMGVTSDDTDLSSLGSYQDLYNGGTPAYVGLDGTNPTPVFHHDGPADGSTGATQDKGKIRVGYTAEINALQQAGDYQNTLTYIATPIY